MAGVIDTVAKFHHINDTSGKFATGENDSGGN